MGCRIIIRIKKDYICNYSTVICTFIQQEDTFTTYLRCTLTELGDTSFELRPSPLPLSFATSLELRHTSVNYATPQCLYVNHTRKGIHREEADCAMTLTVH